MQPRYTAPFVSPRQISGLLIASLRSMGEEVAFVERRALATTNGLTLVIDHDPRSGTNCRREDLGEVGQICELRDW
jgi:hypothetical protein